MPAAVSILPDPGKSLVERKSLIGFRAACMQVWGEPGLQAIRRGLPPEVHERTAGPQPLPKWIEVADLVAWHHAVWNGPAGHDEKVMTRHARATVDQGFGRVKRFLLGIATPHTLAPRVAALWQEEYSSGRLTSTRLEERGVQLTLEDHPYVGDPLMRMVMAEVFRYIVSLTRARGVRVTYGLRGAALVVALHWGSG
jgi:hypothetical protein